MLRTDDWSFYEGYSEVDGNIVMKFYGQVDRNNPDNILITEKEGSDDSYRNNVKVVRQDRREFEDKVYFEAGRLRGLLGMYDVLKNATDDDCAEISDYDEVSKGGAFDEISDVR